MPGWIKSKRFVVQLILVFTLFTLGTVVLLGLPITYLLERQTSIHLTALLDQSTRTTLALYETKNSQIDNMAKLISERPALHQILLDGGDLEALKIYLEDFRQNTRMDAIFLCDFGNTIASADSGVLADLCEVETAERWLFTDTEIWLTADAEITLEEFEIYAVVGKLVDSILEEFQPQSGMDYVLLSNGVVRLSTIDSAGVMSDVASAQPFEHYQIIGTEDAFKVALIPFFDDPSLELVGLLDIGSDLAFNRQIRFIIIGTLLGVSLVGILLAVFLSQRISRPLSILANEAVGIREGDLSTRLSQTSDIWEIQQLTSTLDEARASLKHSLEKIRVEKDWIENLLDSIIEVILAVDNHDRITYASESAEGFLGLPLTHIIGQRMDDLFLTAKGENKFSIQIPGMDQKRQIPVLLNGREVLVAVSVSEFLPPEAGNANRALVIRDVTDEERMHRMLGEFMANITHEFRTPLSALAASLELLMDDLPHLGTEEIDQLLQALNIGIIDLQELIDNLIEAASIEAGRFKVNPQPVSLDSIIKVAVNTIRPIGLKYGVSIIEPVDKPAFSVLADRRRSVQALVNLLSNAVKHSPEGGSVAISILILEDSVVVEVRDEGEGIPPDLQEQLFNRYMTPMASDHTPQLGLGLGLSVVKAIIEAQYGQVGFKGGIERGSIFWFSLKKVTGGED